MKQILPLRQQLKIQNDWLHQRLEQVIKPLMDRADVDMWLILAREYNEDPVIMSLLPEPAMSARRRTILVFHRQQNGVVEHFTVSRYAIPGYYETHWKPEEDGSHDDQFGALARIISERDPRTIAINASGLSAFADGLTHSEYEQLVRALDEPYRMRLVSGENLAIGWLESRIAPEMDAYGGIVEIGHAIIAKMFSSEVIHPGVTTTDDLVWWMRQTMADAGLRAWFQPTIMLQAVDQPLHDFHSAEKRRNIIMPGDLLQCDMGFWYLGLATDQQQHAYIRHPGEEDAPAGLKEALKLGNRVQDIHMQEMAVGKTGNEVLAAILAQCETEGIEAMIYSHPLGYHGHAAGPTIGLWDRQDGVPGLGDYPIYDNTAYSIELNISHPIEEWGGQKVRIMLEEDALLRDGKMAWLDGRQEKFHLV